VAVTHDDVRRAAALARLGLAEDRIPALAAELNGILRHMDVLARVDTNDVDPVHGVGTGGMRLRVDGGPQYPLAGARVAFAPAMRDDFFVVPRVASHAAGGDHEAAGDDA
jgi:aspartyl-tRNA(Asn)/glutamyl-tRNA(Gln) amidotransferase subunit C